ncbi:IS66 family insertion sequence element accessory protein TnpB [Thalassomonas viridans]|uniref:IS66 family insertion sequence element accessory protein TnpB n=1 Tax=Thalassomonas viridans TaxID=137584 RepID=A0AAF0CAT7_9GAMM|nr:IS66 family insertion sequence element accessory protein TnpB [Thalassomonas viridans]WDE06675.1 IS66 family insertion sequence element accessory protein TnpB [Thalassomonas viridans]WDE08747.1 IS66 family insertion sequence element accessory protein TnpB [Thalassomonas viridans]
MKMFVDPPHIYLYRDFVDFRKSINGLTALVELELRQDAYTGALFIFCNKGKDKIKLLYWDKTGFALWYKRLDKQRFKWPSKINDEALALSEQQLDWLLSGFSVLGHEPLNYQSLL